MNNHYVSIAEIMNTLAEHERRINILEGLLLEEIDKREYDEQKRS
jgi:hypothetical protein